MEIPVNYAQANIRFTGNAMPTGAEITLGFNIELYGDTPTALAFDIQNAWTAANFDELYCTTAAVTSIAVKFGPVATGPAGEWVGALVGASAGAAVPPNLSMLVQKHTGFGGRTGRGRLYFPAIPELQVDEGGDLSGTWIAASNAAWESFRTALNGDGAVATLLHSADSPISTPMPITEFVTSPRCATQRRRLRR